MREINVEKGIFPGGSWAGEFQWECMWKLREGKQIHVKPSAMCPGSTLGYT